MAPAPALLPTLAPPIRSRARRAWALTGSIALAVLCALLAISAGGQHGAGESSFPAPVKALAMIGVFPMIGVSVLLVWRHRLPVLVMTIAIAFTVVFPTTPLPALIVVAAVTAVRTGWSRWLSIAGTFLATAVAVTWDVFSQRSLLADLVGESAQGTPERLALLWVVPALAALAVAVFAGFGVLRRVRVERDDARVGAAAATRRAAALRQEVDREHERQELARELHDGLAARLSSLSLHAGALELTTGGEQQETARTVRQAAQASLDELRQIVQVLRDPSAGSSRAGLGDVTVLIDEALAAGMDVRAQLLLSDPESCDPQVAHACYRIVQEAISNAGRHAPGAALRVEVRGAPATGVTLSAANWLVAGASGSAGSGQGLRGMRERAALLGGSLEAGPTTDGGFAVSAWLPWHSPMGATRHG